MNFVIKYVMFSIIPEASCSVKALIVLVTTCMCSPICLSPCLAMILRRFLFVKYSNSLYNARPKIWKMGIQYKRKMLGTNILLVKSKWIILNHINNISIFSSFNISILRYQFDWCEIDSNVINCKLFK